MAIYFRGSLGHIYRNYLIYKHFFRHEYNYRTVYLCVRVFVCVYLPATFRNSATCTDCACVEPSTRLAPDAKTSLIDTCFQSPGGCMGAGFSTWPTLTLSHLNGRASSCSTIKEITKYNYSLLKQTREYMFSSLLELDVLNLYD